MKFFHGEGKKRSYFEGWYLKHQTREGKTLALIPAVHVDSKGRYGASLQVIGERGAWWLEYPWAQVRIGQEPGGIALDGSHFGVDGVKVDIQREGLTLQGRLRYGPFHPLSSDIMGPFRFFGGMQCAHGVLSMGHRLEGELVLNGERYDFSEGMGYVETDRGRSFPDAYLWSQCLWRGREGGSIMLAVATVPMPVGGFTGCICGILYRGREYRLATYRGARIKKWSAAGAEIRQGRYRLTVELLEERKRPLRAPVEGDMDRIIHESLCATVRYTFWRGEELLFCHTDAGASFEYSD